MTSIRFMIVLNTVQFNLGFTITFKASITGLTVMKPKAYKDYKPNQGKDAPKSLTNNMNNLLKTALPKNANVYH